MLHVLSSVKHLTFNQKESNIKHRQQEEELLAYNGSCHLQKCLSWKFALGTCRSIEKQEYQQFPPPQDVRLTSTEWPSMKNPFKWPQKNKSLVSKPACTRILAHAVKHMHSPAQEQIATHAHSTCCYLTWQSNLMTGFLYSLLGWLIYSFQNFRKRV